MDWLQKHEENHKCGWIFKKKVKWLDKQLFARKLRKKMKRIIRTWLKEAKLNAVEFEAEKVHYCDPKKGPLLGENENEAVNEIQDSHIFKTNEFYVDAHMQDGGRLPTTVTKLEEEQNATSVTSNEGEGRHNSYSVLIKEHFNQTQ